LFLFLDETDYTCKEVSEEDFKIVIDDEEISLEPESEIYFTIGGYYCPKGKINELVSKYRDLKEKFFGSKFIPIKNNIYDYKDKYEEIEESLFEKVIKSNMREFRLSLLEDLANINYVESIVSIIQIYSDKRKLHAFPFVNVIQRFAWVIKSKSYECVPQIIMDWNQKEEKRVYEEEYHEIFHTGKDSYGSICKAGSLYEMGFYHSLNFSSTYYDEFLQIADIIIGSWRYLLKKFYNNDYKLEGDDIESLEKLASISREYRGDIFKGGLIFADKKDQKVANRFKVFIREEVI